MKQFIVLLSVAMFLSGCTSVGRVKPDEDINPEESVYILGVAPDNYRISIFPGEVRDGKYHQNIYRVASVYGAAEDGYVIGKAASKETVAIGYIRVVKDKDSLLGTDFKPCKGAQTMVFEIPAGKVLYLGDVKYRIDGDKLFVDYSKDFEAAKKYIDSRYPKLRGRLEPWKYELMQTTIPCTTQIYVPIYRY